LHDSTRVCACMYRRMRVRSCRRVGNSPRGYVVSSKEY
jgi:hypothetical protein